MCLYQRTERNERLPKLRDSFYQMDVIPRISYYGIVHPQHREHQHREQYERETRVKMQRSGIEQRHCHPRNHRDRTDYDTYMAMYWDGYIEMREKVKRDLKHRAEDDSR